MTNASERKSVRAAEKLANLAEKQRSEVVVMLMSTSPGRAYVLGQLERCHVFQTSMSNDARQTAFAEGERNIGLQILNDIMAYCPQQYVVMMQERNERDASRERADTAEQSRREDDFGGTEGRETDDGGVGDANLGADIYGPN